MSSKLLCKDCTVLWKKCQRKVGNTWKRDRIVKLIALGDTVRAAMDRKWKTTKAFVVDVQNLDGKSVGGDVRSIHDVRFKYSKGKVVVAKGPKMWSGKHETVDLIPGFYGCGAGIYGYKDRKRAVKH